MTVFQQSHRFIAFYIKAYQSVTFSSCSSERGCSCTPVDSMHCVLPVDCKLQLLSIILFKLCFLNLCIFAKNFLAFYILLHCFPFEVFSSRSSPTITTRAANPEGSWKKDSIGWWWEYPDGSYATNTWLQINNYWYYFNNDGYMLVGCKRTIASTLSAKSRFRGFS